MRNYIKEIGSHGIIYSISNLLSKAIGLILIPIYAKYLTVSDYGILSIITPFIAIVLVIFDFGLKSRVFQKNNKIPEKKRNVVLVYGLYIIEA